jgi:hypothetical protein
LEYKNPERLAQFWPIVLKSEKPFLEIIITGIGNGKHDQKSDGKRDWEVMNQLLINFRHRVKHSKVIDVHPVNDFPDVDQPILVKNAFVVVSDQVKNNKGKQHIDQGV